MKKLCASLAVAYFAVTVVSAVWQHSGSLNYEDFTRAIRSKDLSALRELAGQPGASRVQNSLLATPLHYAATYGSTEAVRILLAAGANPNARNQQDATPLIYGAWDPARTKLLADKGANVNVAARDGTTPLMVAASAFGNAGSVRYLLEHGANPNALDIFGTDALIRAGHMSDPKVTKLLLARGADAHHADKAGLTALQMALSFSDFERAGLLLKAGADVNSFNIFGGVVKNGPIALAHLTPLMLAAPYAGSESIGALLRAGAGINDIDVRKMSPLILAVATDQAKPSTVKALIAAGADVNAHDQNGESVLDWATKFGNPEMLTCLKAAGARARAVAPAPQPPGNSQASNAAEALARTLPLLSRTSAQFFKEGGGCSGCHHQPMAARAYAAATDARLHTDESLSQAFRNAMLVERPAYLSALPLLRSLPGDFDRILSSLMTLADLHAPASDFTDAAVHYIAARQHPFGAWIFLGIARPPIEDSTISRTAMAIRALQVYGWPARGPEFQERIHRARVWLQNAHPATTYEEADRISGLFAAGVPASDLRADAEALLKEQRTDGGWAQTRYLDSDAYATGLTLKSLQASGMLATDAPAYRRGVAFLLRTQFPDGSWYVRSRAPKFQPYFSSGFPFEHDQWISSAGTAWAAMALAPVAANLSVADRQPEAF